MLGISFLRLVFFWSQLFFLIYSVKYLVRCVETGRKGDSEKHHHDRPMGKLQIA